jgi:hypothetical protein
MNHHHDGIGLIDYLVVELPGNRMTGDALPILVDLVDRGIIRILDLVFVRKDADGSIATLEAANPDGDGTFDLAIFEGASSGLLLKNDIEETDTTLKAGRSAAILIYENLWAAPMVAALRRSGAELVASGRIPLADVVSTLDTQNF